MIWAAHASHGLVGKMRLFTASAQSSFKSRQTDFEFWFSPNETNQVIDLIELHYNSNNANNSPLLLDPVVYKVVFGETPVPQGSGVLWCTVLLPEGQTLNDEALDRLRGANVFASALSRNGQKNAGLKALTFTKEKLEPNQKKKGAEVNYVEGCDELLELVHQGISEMAPYYLLSGLNYHTQFGEFQHESFTSLFGSSGVPAHKFIKSYQVKLQRIKDAAFCWKAYQYNNVLYRRFGVDVVNLDRNLKALADADSTLQDIRTELQLVWGANKRVGLNGQMRLYTLPGQDPVRALHAGTERWFTDTPESLDETLQFLKLEYNGGNLPNTPLLLDPFVYNAEKQKIGTGVIWATALGLGIEDVKPESFERIRGVGAFAGEMQRGPKAAAGIKILAFSDTALQPLANGEVPGNAELYALANLEAPMYRSLYFLSSLEYLTVHGSFQQLQLGNMFSASDSAMSNEQTVPLQRLKDAAKCFEAYDRNHSLYRRFGVDVPNLESNLRYYNLCARDFELLDATGPSRAGAEEEFEMLVDGWIPRGAITLIAASGGTGKSSLAHYLCVLASIDWKKDEEPPLWLGSRINKELCQGICVYFSGEDGPAIVNARAETFDPTGRSKRLMFQRTDFGFNKKGEAAKLDEFLERLEKMPSVPIMVIDPARKYLEGDEDNSEVVSNFFEAIEEFSIRKKTACVVVHHLAKGAKPRDTGEVLDCLRGSQVFVDRPRVVIGLLREGPYTIAGLAKNNIPPQLGMVQDERVFVRDPASLQLLWLPGEKGIRRKSLSEDELEQLKREQGV